MKNILLATAFLASSSAFAGATVSHTDMASDTCQEVDFLGIGLCATVTGTLHKVWTPSGAYSVTVDAVYELEIYDLETGDTISTTYQEEKGHGLKLDGETWQQLHKDDCVEFNGGAFGFGTFVNLANGEVRHEVSTDGCD